jgi:hypothetical protein
MFGLRLGNLAKARGAWGEWEWPDPTKLLRALLVEDIYNCWSGMCASTHERVMAAA